MIKKLVVFEGLDGSGKSTLGRRVAADLDFAYAESPPAPFAAIREQVATLRSRPSKVLFYLAGNLVIPQVLAESPSNGLVLSRYIHSTLAYAAVDCFRSMESTLQWVGPALDELLKPDLVVRLYVEEQVRLQRITERGEDEESMTDARLGRGAALHAAFDEAFTHFPVPTINVRSDLTDISETVAHILSHPSSKLFTGYKSET